MLLTQALERQICEFEASLVYRGSSRTARAIQRNPISKMKKKEKEKKRKEKSTTRNRKEKGWQLQGQ
jgi:hypothetical protein